MSKNTTHYKDMKKFSKARRRYNKKYYKRTAVYEKRAWTEDEDKLVLDCNITDTELSAFIQRSVQSIQVRRTRLKQKELDQI